MLKALLSILFVVFMCNAVLSQADPLFNERTRDFAISELPQSLDSLTVISNSIQVFYHNEKVDSLSFRFENNQLYWMDKTIPGTDSILVAFRVIPYDLSKSYSHLDTTQIEVDDDGDYIGFEINPYGQREGLIDFKGLDYNGSFARGISFGNNQNLVLNSSFNLQLSGNIGDDVEILAAISDNNIPLQPEGNTAQLQEFDKIFIQIKRKNNSLTAGDYELARPNSYFMNYFKKLQGATYANESEVFKNGTLNTRASVAVARGKFARNILAQQEGNQGPYRLQGNNGERFIIILAGTEKVFIDGELLKRGVEEDYIIDYNRGDVTFTNKRLITKDRRIIVEFEYADQSYLRSMYAFNTEFQNDKLRVYLNLFSEQDSKTSGGARDLDSLQRAILQDAGDDLDMAFAPGIDSLEVFDEFRVTYKLIDTTYFIMGLPQDTQILVYSTNRDSALYAANFTEVGFGNGNYIFDPTTGANGRVYRWVAPDPLTGKPQGNFVPKVQLIAPTKKAMYTLGAEYQLSKNSSILTEVALSNYDLNRFSKKGDGDDTKMAFFTRYRNDRALGKPENGWNLQTELNYEFVQENFQQLNPYRNAEFSRDWNIDSNPLNSNNAQEQIGKGGFTISKQNLGSLQYEFAGFLRQSLYTGTKHFARATIRQKGFNFDVQGSLLSTDSDLEESTFFRPKVDISQTFKKLDNWRIGVYGEREKNDRFATGSDTLAKTSFYYDLYKIYLESKADEKFTVGLNYTQRFDYQPVSESFTQSTLANDFNLNGKWSPKPSSNLQWNLTYRQLEIESPDITDIDPQETFLGRLQHSLSLWKGVIRSTTNYEISSGQEPKLEYQYLPVQPGEGVYTWIADLNGDSIPQINEIEEAAFQNAADIIRVSIVTDDFIRTNNVQLNESLRIDPRSIWYQKKDWRKFASKFSTQSTLRIIRKSRDAEGVSPWNPFQIAVADTALVSVASGIRNTLFFNRANPVYDLQFSQIDNRNKVVLTSGFESRKNSEQIFRSRWNIGQKLSSIVSLSRGIKSNDSEFFDNRDYTINFYRLEPQLTYLPVRNFRTILTYRFQNSENTLPDGGEKAINHDFNLETTFNKTSQTSIRLNLSFVKVSYNGESNSTIEFAMLDGLQDGNNYLWNLILDRRLAKNIQLSISYEGRKTGSANTVHVGRAQVRATF